MTDGLLKLRRTGKNEGEEILTRWNGLMGTWPALIKDQKIEIIESTHKGWLYKKPCKILLESERENGRLSCLFLTAKGKNLP